MRADSSRSRRRVTALVAAMMVAGLLVGVGATTLRARPAAADPGAGVYVPLPPARILDTRSGGGPIGPGATLAVLVLGQGGVPTSGVSAVAFTLTATPLANATSDYLTVYPTNWPLPDTSNLNPTPGRTVSDAVIVPPGLGGQVNIYNHTGDVDLIVDVSGYYTSAAGTEVFHPLANPVRIYQYNVGPGSTNLVAIAGVDGIPASGVAAVAVALGAGGPSDNSFLTAYADGSAQPATSNVSVNAGVDVTTLAQPQVGNDGYIDVSNHVGSLQLSVDVEGYYTSTYANGGSSYRPTDPSVLYDTRNGGSPLGPGETRPFTVARPPLSPPNTVAVALTVTTVNATAPSYMTEWPSGIGAPFPPTAILNPSPGAATADLVLAKIGSDAQIQLYNNAGTTDVIISLDGFYLDTSTAYGPAPLNEQGGALFDAPDPAAVNLSSTHSQIYATGTVTNRANIFSENWTTGTPSFMNQHDALLPNPSWQQGQPGQPTYLSPRGDFAPSVAYIGGQYVMWFSGVNTNGLPNCLESATSPTPDGQFTVTGPSPYCDPNQFPIYDSQGNIVGGNEGDFDPSIYRDPFFGGLWLYYSQEFSEKTGGGNASIHVVALSPDGTAIPAGTDYTIATQADVAAALPPSSVPPGDNPQIENPQMDGDYGNQISPNDGQPVAYDLYLSYGTYSQTGAYHTVELGCEFVIGPCFDRNPALQDYSLESGEGQNLVNPGGMSLAFGGPIGEYALFAAQLSGDPPAPTGARGMFYENPSSVQGDYGATTSAPYQTQDNQVP